MMKLSKVSSVKYRIKNRIYIIQKRLCLEYRMRRRYIKLEGIKIRVGQHMSPSIKTAIYNGCYEQIELKLIKCHVSPSDTLMEIGAGIGLVSSYCARIIGSEKVYAYEANPELERHIHDTYKLNSVSPTLQIALVGEQTGEQTFYITKEFWSSSIIQPTAKETAIAIKIPVKSFNQEVRRLNPTFLIIDIEGGEYELLKYADFYNVQKIVIELHNIMLGHEKSEFVKSKLAEAGFQIIEEFSNSGDEVLFVQKYC